LATIQVGKIHQIDANSTTTEATDKIRTYLEASELIKLDSIKFAKDLVITKLITE
jgi:hypothetical protein